MPYTWNGTGTLTRVHGEDIQPGDTFEPTDAELESFGDAIEATDMEDESNSESAEPTAHTPDEDTEDTPVEDKEYAELRQMAMDADTDEINGRSSADEIIAYFTE